MFRLSALHHTAKDTCHKILGNVSTLIRVLRDVVDFDVPVCVSSEQIPTSSLTQLTDSPLVSSSTSLTCSFPTICMTSFAIWVRFVQPSLTWELCRPQLFQARCNRSHLCFYLTRLTSWRVVFVYRSLRPLLVFWTHSVCFSTYVSSDTGQDVMRCLHVKERQSSMNCIAIQRTWDTCLRYADAACRQDTWRRNVSYFVDISTSCKFWRWSMILSSPHKNTESISKMMTRIEADTHQRLRTIEVMKLVWHDVEVYLYYLSRGLMTMTTDGIELNSIDNL